ncbi:MAG: cell division protein FtsQ/DivIB [Pseudomonadota bacterium]
MRSLIGQGRRRDPAPSRLAFRIKRNWRSGRLRRLVTLWLPVLVLVATGGWVVSQPDLRAAAIDRYADLRAEVSERPEFAIRKLDIRGGDPEVTKQITTMLSGYVGSSSLTADVGLIRKQVTDLGWIAAARVRLSAPETLIVSVDIRTPAAIWRHQGRLMLVDDDGAQIAPLATRAERSDLPIIAGEGADRGVSEARAIIAAAGPLNLRLRGLVRIGERRWDMVLQDGPTVMLPAADPLSALGYLVSLEDTKSMTARDVSHIDLRLRSRPTLRLNPDALETLKTTRQPNPPGEDA